MDQTQEIIMTSSEECTAKMNEKWRHKSRSLIWSSFFLSGMWGEIPFSLLGRKTPGACYRSRRNADTYRGKEQRVGAEPCGSMAAQHAETLGSISSTLGEKGSMTVYPVS